MKKVLGIALSGLFLMQAALTPVMGYGFGELEKDMLNRPSARASHAKEESPRGEAQGSSWVVKTRAFAGNFLGVASVLFLVCMAAPGTEAQGIISTCPDSFNCNGSSLTKTIVNNGKVLQLGLVSQFTSHPVVGSEQRDQISLSSLNQSACFLTVYHLLKDSLERGGLEGLQKALEWQFDKK